jgi:drug/metabolite transporter (DMT)-like permease
VSVHAALIAVQLMFASLSVAAKVALRELPPFGLIAFRVPAAFLVLLAVRATRPWQRVARRDLPELFAYAFFAIIANQLLFMTGLKYTTATNAVVIGSTIPVFTVGVALALGRERSTPAKLLGLAVAFGGALSIVGAGQLEAGGMRMVGNLLLVGNSLSFAIYLVIGRRLMSRYDTTTVVTWIFGFGSLGVVPFGGGVLAAHAHALHASTWLALLYIVAFPSVGAYFLNAYALRRAPSSLVAIYIYLQPVIGALMAAVVLGERPTTATAIGGLFIGLGIWLVARVR